MQQIYIFFNLANKRNKPMSMKIHFIQRINAYYVSGLSTYNMSSGLNCMRGLIKT